MLLPIVITFAVLDIAVYALGVYVNRSWLWPVHNLRFVINMAKARYQAATTPDFTSIDDEDASFRDGQE